MAAITPGRYRARAVDHKFGKTSKGTDQVLVTFEVTQDEHKGHRFYWYGFFSEKTIDRTLESLEHCGWDGKGFKDMSSLRKNEVELTVENETNEGETYLRVRWVNRLGGGGVKEELDAAGISALEERCQAAILDRRQRREYEGADAGGGDGPPV